MNRSNTRGSISRGDADPRSVPSASTPARARLQLHHAAGDGDAPAVRRLNFRALWSRFDDDLDEPRRVDVEPHRARTAVPRPARAGPRSGPARLASMAPCTSSGSRLIGSALQPDLARRDARHVQQVVDQPDHVADLPLHHRRAPVPPRTGCRRRAASAPVPCGPAPAGCAARARGRPGTRSCAGPPPSTRARSGAAPSPPRCVRAGRPPGGPGCRTGGTHAPSAPGAVASGSRACRPSCRRA